MEPLFVCIIQMVCNFVLTFTSDFGRRQIALRPEMEQCTVYSSELENLQKLLHFPEEVAIKLTQTEHALFTKVNQFFLMQVKR